MALSTMTLSMTPLIIMALSIMTLSIAIIGAPISITTVDANADRHFTEFRSS
jgi:hypothetical protein